MKAFIVLCSASVAVYMSTALSLKEDNSLPNEIKPYQAGDRYVYIQSDGDGSIQLVDTSAKPDQRVLQTLINNPFAFTRFFLFTRRNPFTPVQLHFGDIETLIKSHFHNNKITVIVCHGWNMDASSEMNIKFKEAFLEQDDVNFIVVDWGALARLDYMTAKYGTAAVGRTVGVMIVWLVALGASYKRIHLIGFSLGGQLVGSAGRITGSRIQRITALDPAWLSWEGDIDRITEADAKYVEVIHTNTLIGGYPYPCGHADFYPNGGAFMPGCDSFACSHERAYEYMYATVKYNHMIANACDNFIDATAIGRVCNGEKYPMGNSDLNKKG